MYILYINQSFGGKREKREVGKEKRGKGKGGKGRETVHSNYEGTKRRGECLSV